jgi:DMATS type aromatic prenyltransferase
MFKFLPSHHSGLALKSHRCAQRRHKSNTLTMDSSIVTLTEVLCEPIESLHLSTGAQVQTLVAPAQPEFPSSTKYWHDLSTDSLLTLLRKCKYPTQEIAYFVSLWSHILPYLDSTSPHSKSKLSRDGTPYDIQWNLVASPQSTSKSIIRVSFDIARQPKDLITSLSTLGFLTPENANTDLLDSALSTLKSIIQLDQGAHTPWFASGIDMLRTRHLLYKIYLRPATNSARNLSHTRADAIISTWDERFFHGGLQEAYAVIEKYNLDLEDEEQQKIHMIGWDCVSTEMTRVKVYTYHSHTSLRGLKDMWTQRGQLSGSEIDTGLRCIEELWTLLFVSDGESDWPDDKELLSRLLTPQSICLGLEITPGAKLPTPKLYLQPARFGTKSDREISEALSGWFTERGFGEISNSYVQDFEEIL